jgi:DeoR/GlpR family transcriptional regulator of sugar metabolism
LTITGSAFDSQNVKNKQRVYEAVTDHGPVSPAEIQKITEIPPATIYRMLTDLQEAKFVEKVGRGKYASVASQRDRMINTN